MKLFPEIKLLNENKLDYGFKEQIISTPITYDTLPKILKLDKFHSIPAVPHDDEIKVGDYFKLIDNRVPFYQLENQYQEILEKQFDNEKVNETELSETSTLFLSDQKQRPNDQN